MNRVFADTSGFIALEDAADQNHMQARSFQQLARQENIRLVTTNYVLAEAYTWIRLHLGHKQAVNFGKTIQASKLVTVIRVDVSQEQEAWTIFVRHADKTYSYTDCTSFAVMKQLSLDRAFAFDRHFSQFGFQLVPGTA